MEEPTLDLDIPSLNTGKDEAAQRAEDSRVTTLKEGEVDDFIDGGAIKETAKEKVRQRVARALFHEHGIAPSDMARDFPITVGGSGGRRKKADIAVFARDTEHTEKNLRRVVVCKPEPKRGKHVVKLREPEQAEKDLQELKDLLGHEARPECADGLWTDGMDFFFLKKKVTPFGATYEDRSDWDVTPESVGSRTVASHQRLRRAEPEMLKTTFQRCHRYIHGNEGMPKDAAFWQFLYLLFTKMYDERKSRGTGKAKFYAGMTELFTDKGRTDIRQRIEDLFKEVKREYADGKLFKSTDEITLSDKALAFIVSELAPYDLGGTDVDAKGIAYQELVGTNLRGDRGQYFTPRSAVKLMVEILDPQEDETVLDPTCGTGGFLAETLNHLHHKWQKEEGTFGFPDTPEQQERYRDKLRSYAEKYLFGADFDPFLVRATTMNVMTLANTTGNVFHMDSLAFPQGHLSGAAPAGERIPLGKAVDVLLTNPPFGSDIPVSDEAVLGRYRDGVAKSWSRDKETGELVESLTSWPASMAPEQLFIQRAIEWVKPGGRIGIVLPNGILSNPGPSDEAIRRYILEHCWVLASIELPVEAFIADANVNILTTLLFLKRKTDTEVRNYRSGSEQPYPVFMAVAEKVGVDRRGNTLFKRHPDGEILTEATIERESIRINGDWETKEFKRTKRVVDNDLPEIVNKYYEFREKYPVPGAGPCSVSMGVQE